MNVRAGDLDQLLLMPPSVREWLPEDHLAFFVIDVVAELDLAEFYRCYRDDGRGGVRVRPHVPSCVRPHVLSSRRVVSCLS